MRPNERVVENLNRGLHALFAQHPDVFLIGEDLTDPYGGAFKVSKGLSSNYADRVLSTPLSESAIVGLAGGLALTGNKPIVEIMFGDFITLGFDQILNFASKSVSMYGKTVPMSMIIRCPIGGNRSYGPTHSQSLQKHFIGIPHLRLFELSPFVDNTALLEKLVGLNVPCILFEDKVLYTQPIYRDGKVDDLFTFELFGPDNGLARVVPDGMDEHDCLVIAPGGMFTRCLAAAKDLLIEHELSTQILVPSQLYPFDIEPICELITAAKHVFIVEESVAGGTWGSEIASQIYDTLWGHLQHKIHLIHSQDRVIPCASHLEKQTLVQTSHIYRAITAEVLHA